MKKLLALIVAMSAILIAPSATASAPARTGATTTATYDYGPAELVARYDASRTGAPAIVWIHGGWWRTGSENSDAAAQERFAARGYQVFSVDYRKTPEAVWPAQRQDAIAAIAWIRARASTFHIDPQRIAIVGGSAGGHIGISAAANLPAGSKVVAIVGLAAVNDPWALWLAGQGAPYDPQTSGSMQTKGMDNSTLLVGCSRVESEACDARWIDAWAPYRLDSSDGDLADWHCDGDGTIPLSQGQRLIARAQGQGVTAVLRVENCDTHNVLAAPGVEADVADYLAHELGLGQSSRQWRAGR